MKTLLTAALCAAACLPLQARAAEDAALQAAIAASHRTPAFVARDAARHPYETLRFFGIKPNMTVVELSPGAGWYTEILAPYLRDKGQLILAAGDPDSTEPGDVRTAERLSQKFASAPAVYDRVKVGAFKVPAKLSYAPRASADLVLTFRNVHNWINIGDEALPAVFKSAFDALKSGGSFGVVEHRLPEQRVQDSKASTGYVHTRYIVSVAEKAGFKLAASSEVNANPRDDADHEGGVWALPPTLANKDKDREKYLAIGESDRMTLRFVKP